jgi:3-deoxy-7-phosphoheptulonate synthase
MIIQLKKRATQEDIGKTVERLMQLAAEVGIEVHYHTVQGEELPVVAVKAAGADIAKIQEERLRQLDCVEDIKRIAEPYKLAPRSYLDRRIIKAGGIDVGGNRLCIIAGPCAVESEGQIMKAARDVKAAGADMLRGGAYKPRTSPYSFQGLQEEGLRLLRKAGDENGLPIVTEITDPRNIDKYQKHRVDVYQVGARNCQNYDLLKALTELRGSAAAVLLKRGMATTLEELINAAEYLLAGNVQNVMICLRGIKGIDLKYTRNSIDTGDISVLVQNCNIPVIYDPSHACGKRALVPETSLGAVGHGAHGLMIEAHPDPENALSDGHQSLYSAKDPANPMGLSRVIEGVRRYYDFRLKMTGVG